MGWQHSRHLPANPRAASCQTGLADERSSPGRVASWIDEARHCGFPHRPWRFFCHLGGCLWPCRPRHSGAPPRPRWLPRRPQRSFPVRKTCRLAKGRPAGLPRPICLPLRTCLHCPGFPPRPRRSSACWSYPRRCGSRWQHGKLNAPLMPGSKGSGRMRRPNRTHGAPCSKRWLVNKGSLRRISSAPRAMPCNRASSLPSSASSSAAMPYSRKARWPSATSGKRLSRLSARSRRAAA